MLEEVSKILLSKGLLTHEHTACTKYVPGGQVLGSGSPIGLRMMNIVSVSLWVSKGQSVKIEMKSVV